MKLQLVFFILLMGPVAAFSQTPPPETDGPPATAEVSWQAQQYFAYGDYQKLDALFERHSNPNERLDDGRWPLRAIEPGIRGLFDSYNEWELMGKKIAEWKTQKPDSTGAAITEAIYWNRYAWAARGEGTAGTVTPEGWELFRERLERGRQVLEQSRSYASNNPLWYDQYLEVALGQGWSQEKYQELFDEAIELQPYYYDHYFSMTRYLTPRWHGSYEELEQFARAAIENTAVVEGHTLYARIYWFLNQIESFDFRIFEDSHASWDLMKKGFEDLMARYPNSYWNLNNFASFACRAGDKKTYQGIRKRIGKEVFHMAWPSNYSLEICDARLMPPDNPA